MTSPSLEWCEARVEARSLFINALLQLLHTSPAGLRAAAVWRQILEREAVLTTNVDLSRRVEPMEHAGTHLVQLAQELSTQLSRVNPSKD
jgi:hypothetical protein